MLPLVLVELALVAAPMALGAFYSLYRVDYFELTQFRGLGNYWTVLTSPMVRDALGATVVFSLFSLVFTIGLGMALSMRLEADSRTNVWLRAIVLIQAGVLAVVGLVFGVPLGLALGRTLWRSVADTTPIEYIPPLAVWALVLVAAAALLAAALLAAWPSQRARTG